MHMESVGIHSDQANMPVLRHPARTFPGILVQGDTLHAVCARAAEARAGGPDAQDELDALHRRLQDLLSHDKDVLRQHRIDLPFQDAPDV